jgi:hypothetical protein
MPPPAASTPYRYLDTDRRHSSNALGLRLAERTGMGIPCRAEWVGREGERRRTKGRTLPVPAATADLSQERDEADELQRGTSQQSSTWILGKF